MSKTPTPDIMVFDFETSGLKEDYHEILQIGAIAYNHRTFEPYPDGEFKMLVRPKYPERATPKAMEVNGLDLKELEKAAGPETVWPAFAKWVSRYNVGPSKGVTTAPVPAGKNIRGFDLKWVDVYNEQFAKGGKGVLFNDRRMVDLEDILTLWIYFNPHDMRGMGMDKVREWFGMEVHPTHDALVDCREEGELIMFFMKLQRYLGFEWKKKDGSSRLPLKGRFAQLSQAA